MSYYRWRKYRHFNHHTLDYYTGGETNNEVNDVQSDGSVLCSHHPAEQATADLLFKR